MISLIISAAPLAVYVFPLRNKSVDTGFEFITKSELNVVTDAPRLFGIVPSDIPFLVAFYIDYTAVNINSDDFELALSQQLFEDLEVDSSQFVGCFVTEVPQKP